mgnify:FL=1
MKTKQTIDNNFKDYTVVLLEQLANCETELQINTINGSVYIDSKTLNFCYTGKFGCNVLNQIIKQKITDIPDKIIVLIRHIELYEQKIGGVTYLSK